MANKQVERDKVTSRKVLTTHTTMLELVYLLTQQTDDYRKVVTAVAQRVNNGQVRLTGTFKDARRIEV